MLRIGEVIKNIWYTLSSNLISLLISILVTLILPKLLGVDSYGFFQLYLFYTSYIGLLHFGWCDGIYIRYGGKHFNELNMPLLRGQYLLFVIFQIIITIILFVIGYILGELNSFVIIFSICNVLVMNVRTFLTFILQATNRMKEYAIITILDRILFFILVIILVLIRITDFRYYILVDFLSKAALLLYSIIFLNEITNPFGREIYFSILETKKNVVSGINILLAYLSSLLIIGFIRMGIQKQWGISVFSNVSLTLSLSNMLMVFINAVSMALFPLLKRTTESQSKKAYILIRRPLTILTFSILLMYFPIRVLLVAWLPKYSGTIEYMGIIFPIIIFEAKNSLLNNTYLKMLRKEKDIFYVNLFICILSYLLSVLTIKIFNSVLLSVLLILFLLMLRSLILDVIISKYLYINNTKNILVEISVTILFLYCNMELSLLISFIIYSLFISYYVWYNRSVLFSAFQMIKTK